MPKPAYTLLLLIITLALSSCAYTGVTNRTDYIDARGLPAHQISSAIQINFIPVCRVTPGRFPAPRRGDHHQVEMAVESLDWAVIVEGQGIEAD